MRITQGITSRISQNNLMDCLYVYLDVTMFKENFKIINILSKSCMLCSRRYNLNLGCAFGFCRCCCCSFPEMFIVVNRTDDAADDRTVSSLTVICNFLVVSFSNVEIFTTFRRNYFIILIMKNSQNYDKKQFCLNFRNSMLKRLGLFYRK